MNTKTFFLMAIVLVAAFGMLVGTVNAATIVYESGFEAPAYAVGTVDGQDGWVVDAGGDAGSTISDATEDVITGDQSLVVVDMDNV